MGVHGRVTVIQTGTAVRPPGLFSLTDVIGRRGRSRPSSADGRVKRVNLVLLAPSLPQAVEGLVAPELPDLIRIRIAVGGTP